MSRLRLTSDVREELEAVRTAHDGMLRPQDVVAAARKEGTALWHFMDQQGLWDPKTAQERALDMAARLLIVRVKVTVLDAKREPIRTRAYVSLVDDRPEGRGYRHILDVVHDDVGALLESARRDVLALQRKCETLTEIAPLLKALEEALERARQEQQQNAGGARLGGNG